MSSARPLLSPARKYDSGLKNKSRNIKSNIGDYSVLIRNLIEMQKNVKMVVIWNSFLFISGVLLVKLDTNFKF